MKRVLPSPAMLDRARCRLVLLCLLAPLGCRPEPQPASTPAAHDPGGPTAAVDAPSESDGEDPADPAVDPNAEVEADPEVEATPESPSESEAQTEPEASAEATQPESKSEPERAPLPKPIHKPGDGSCVKKFAVGQKVKNFKLPSLAGDKTISPAGYRNRVVLLNFWATWCKPCLAELPEFDRLYRKYRRHGMTLVAVTTDEDPKLVQDFVDEHKLVAKIALSGEEAAGAYSRPQFPFSFVVDGDGTIIAAFDYVDDACLGDLEAVIRDSLEQL